MILETLSGNLTLAVPTHARGFTFDSEETKDAEPSGDGIHTLIDDNRGRTESSQIVVLPFCLGCPGAIFFMRVSAWWSMGKNRNTQVWIRMILNTSTCVAGSQRGFKGRVFSESEYLALNSVTVPTFGAKKIEFEFVNDPNYQVGMNAFWAIA